MNLRRFIYRLIEIRDGPVVPAVCYAPCNNTCAEGQRTGLEPDLCAPTSAFMKLLALCQSCVIAHGNSTTVYVFADGDLGPFLSYCDDLAANSSQLSLISAAATVQSVLASKVSVGSVSISTQISTVISVSILTLQESSATPTSDPTSSLKPAPSSNSKVWIVGAVIGPLFVLFAFTVVLFFYHKRKRNKNLNETRTATEDADKKAGDGDDKAQLHGNSLVVTRHELEGETSPEIVSELPALEPVGTELQVGKHI